MFEYKVKLERTQVSEDTVRFNSTSAVSDLLVSRFGMREDAQEVSYLITLDSSLNVIGFQLLSRGGLTQTTVDLIVLFRSVFLSGSSRFIITHNHPTASAEPSYDDIKLTEEIKKMAQTLHLQFLDHIIVGVTDTYSFAEHDLI